MSTPKKRGFGQCPPRDSGAWESRTTMMVIVGVKVALSPNGWREQGKNHCLFVEIVLLTSLFTKPATFGASFAVWSTIPIHSSQSVWTWFIINCTAITAITCYNCYNYGYIIVIWTSFGPSSQWSTHQPSFGSSLGAHLGSEAGLRPVISGDIPKYTEMAISMRTSS